MNVYIIDYGMGNLLSVKRAFEECGATVKVTDNPDDLINATHIILPGVGAFEDGITNLKSKSWDIALHKAVKDNKAILGICLGMQLLLSNGYEGGTFEGLSLVKGSVVKLISKNETEKIPHVGWNNVNIIKKTALFDKIPNDSDFYFVHSFHAIPEDSADIIGITDYCGEFTSVIQHGNVYGVQFHPEKSGKMGFQLIKNFLEL